MKNDYELMLVIKRDTEEKDKEKLIDLIKKTIDSGKITKKDDWGKRLFTYPIKKEKEGTYLLLTLEIDGKEAVKIPDILRNNEQVLRYLLVRKE